MADEFVVMYFCIALFVYTGISQPGARGPPGGHEQGVSLIPKLASL